MSRRRSNGRVFNGAYRDNSTGKVHDVSSVMPGLVPLLSGSVSVKRLGTRIWAHWRFHVAVPSVAPLSPTVMPGLVPGIHVPPLPRPSPARTAMPQDVDARNKSGHDEEGADGKPETVKMLLTRDMNRTIFLIVGKWGRRRCWRPFPLPGPTARDRARVRHFPAGLCRRKCRQAGRVGKCRPGSDLSTRCPVDPRKTLLRVV